MSATELVQSEVALSPVHRFGASQSSELGPAQRTSYPESRRQSNTAEQGYDRTWVFDTLQRSRLTKCPASQTCHHSATSLLLRARRVNRILRLCLGLLFCLVCGFTLLVAFRIRVLELVVDAEVPRRCTISPRLCCTRRAIRQRGERTHRLCSAMTARMRLLR